MLHLLRRALLIHKGERRTVAILFLHYFLVSSAVIAGKSARDALFLGHYGKSALPLMYVANALAIALAVAILSRVSKTLSVRATTTGALALFATSLILISVSLNGFAIAVLYVWMEVVGSIIVLHAWNLAGNAFNPRQAKRLFGVVAAGGSIAAVAGGAGVASLASRYAAPVVIGVVASVLALAAVTAWFASALEAPKPKTFVAAPATPAKLKPYTLTIAVIVVASSVLSALIQYRFQVGAAAAFPDSKQLIVFFGRFYSWTGGASLLTQLFLSRFLLARFGLIAGLAILPGCFTAGAFMTLVWPSLWSVGFSRFSDLTFKYTINNASLEMLWLPVPPEERRAVKPFVAGTLKAVSEAGTGLLMFLLVNVAPIWVLSVAAVAACSVWMAAVNRLRGLYRSALAGVIAKSQLDAGTLRIDAHDATVIASFEQVLRTGSEAEQISALGFLDGFSVSPWAAELRKLYREGSPEVREAVLHVAADDRDVIPDEWILDSLRAGEPSAADIATHRGIERAKPLLRTMLESTDVKTSITAAAALLRDGDQSEARARVESWLDSDDASIVNQALNALPPDFAAIDPARLRRCLNALDANAVRAALRLAGSTRDGGVIDAIIACLGRPRCAMQARFTLRQCPEADVVGMLTTAVTSDSTDNRLRSNLLRALTDYPASVAESRIRPAFSVRALGVYDEYSALLDSIQRVRVLDPSVIEQVGRDLQEVADLAHAVHVLRGRFSHDPDAVLLRDYTDQQRSAAIAIAIRLTAVKSGGSFAERCLEVTRSGDPARLPFVLELLDSTLSREQARLLIPLMDVAQDQPDGAGRAYADPDLSEAVEQLSLYAPDSDLWAASIVRHYLNRKKGPGVAMEDEMRSILERTIYLKTSELFRGVAAESLSRLAAVAAETSWPSGAVVFKEGDAGDALFVVLSGTVQIAKNGIEIAVLHKGACFGEMAVLDGAPRSADAVVCDEAILLRIGSEEFYEIMAENPPLMRNVISVLSRRLRDTNVKVARTTAN